MHVYRHPCASFSSLESKQERFFAFDSVTGKRQELTKPRIQSEDYHDFNWSLSAGGETLASAQMHPSNGRPSIRLLSTHDGTERTIQVPGWAGIRAFDWAADGKSLWVSAYTNAGKKALLNVNVNGKIMPALEENKMILGWGSFPAGG